MLKSKDLDLFPLELSASEAYLKSKEILDRRHNAVEKFMKSSISMTLLVNFLGNKIDKAIKRGEFHLELKAQDFESFSTPFTILIDATILICEKQNYSTRLKQDGSLVINWSSQSVKVFIEPIRNKKFVFKKPKELN